MQSRQAFATVPINPFSNGPRADAYGLRDSLRRLPALDLQYNPLSTARRQPGILVHVHPVLRWNLKLQQPQLPRSEPDGPLGHKDVRGRPLFALQTSQGAYLVAFFALWTCNSISAVVRSDTRGDELRNLQWLVPTGRPCGFPRYFARVRR